eukprot:84882-Prymnesium_polylepis.2
MLVGHGSEGATGRAEEHAGGRSKQPAGAPSAEHHAEHPYTIAGVLCEESWSCDPFPISPWLASPPSPNTVLLINSKQ